MRITIITTDVIGRQALKMLDKLEEKLRAADPAVQFTFGVEDDSTEQKIIAAKAVRAPRTAGKRLGPRVQYRAIFPHNMRKRETIMELVEKNLQLMNKKDTTQHAVIYRDIVNATLEGKMLTKEYFVDTRSYPPPSVERVIGDFTRGKLVEVVPIVRAEGE